MPIVNSGRNQTGNGPDRCPGQTPATRLRPLPVYSAARQRSAPKPRPESASPSSSQVRTPAFQAGNTGSNPVGDTIAPAGTMLAPAGFGRRASPAARSAGSYPVGDAALLPARCWPQRDSVGAPRLRLGALGRIPLGTPSRPPAESLGVRPVQNPHLLRRRWGIGRPVHQIH